VAHDFNNILAAMMLQARLSIGVENTPKEVVEGLQQIHAAAERAADLVRQLLLFSRKQTIQPRSLNLNDVVKNITKMLQRLIGEDVHLQLQLCPAPLMTRADSGTLDQVLMNLAINSRDAMTGGGQLLIETTDRNISAHDARLLHPDAKPGRYVCLRVSDSGKGIDPEIMPHIFEPFFTTKEAGKGTGLGLATVYGIVKQHNGFINVTSESGKGAHFSIFLPACKAAPECSAPTAQPVPRGGTETILLVEDDEAVRLITRALLLRHGYSVLEAANGIHALKIWEEQRDTIALVLTDLVMPNGLGGLELVEQLRRENPDLKAVFVSGYNSELAGRQFAANELKPGENYIQKPFSPDQLLETIRRRLDKE
jgi:CheY-like chemotaxis protein